MDGTTICSRRPPWVPDVRRLTLESSIPRETEYKGGRQNLESDSARLKLDIQNSKSDQESIRLTNASNSRRNSEFIKQIEEWREERTELRQEAVEVSTEAKN